MAAVHSRLPRSRFYIFTTISEKFFLQSPIGPHQVVSYPTDIGIVQKSPLEEDPAATLERLDAFLPFTEKQTDALCRRLESMECRLALCDIAPLGIFVAGRVGIPSVLVENFTWDWLYAPYAKQYPGFLRHMEYLQSLFSGAEYRIQTSPLCERRPSDLHVGPISRQIRTSSEVVRERLRVGPDEEMVLVTLGGVPGAFAFQEMLKNRSRTWFVTPGACKQLEWDHNIIHLPQFSDFFHPDIVNAANVVFGKAGYSTIAEVYNAGNAFGYLLRSEFRESGKLRQFIEKQMPSALLLPEAFGDNSWQSLLDSLMALPRRERNEIPGAEQVAGFIMDRLKENC